MINFENTYSKLPKEFFFNENPAVFKNPKILAFNEDLAKELGIEVGDADLAKVFSGQEIIKGSEPLAMAYAGHQFGHFVPQLGDGRALLLGETKGFDIQLKGAGQTPFSRRGDGLSALGPVIREYLVSEGMHHLGASTTRALAAVITNEEVYRNGPEPGGIFTRVAASHLRVGTFQFFAAREDTNSLKTLLDYAIKRHYPEVNTPIQFLIKVAKAQASLVNHWMSLGFIHGVMNTDNSSIAGITIDFGPCAFMDEFNFKKVFSSIDQNGRYAYINQGPITHWNIARLAECLIPLIDEDSDKAIAKIQEALAFLPTQINNGFQERMSKKLGLPKVDEKLVESFLQYLETESLDFTLSFRYLPDLFSGTTDFYPDTEQLRNFLEQWKPVAQVEGLNQINPLYIPRNHQIQRVIDDVYSGRLESFHEMHKVLKKPFEEQPELDHYRTPPEVDERITETFCGT